MYFEIHKEADDSEEPYWWRIRDDSHLTMCTSGRFGSLADCRAAVEVVKGRAAEIKVHDHSSEKETQPADAEEPIPNSSGVVSGQGLIAQAPKIDWAAKEGLRVPEVYGEISERITAEITAWPGIVASVGERGEWSFTLGPYAITREVGHLHGDTIAHFVFTTEDWQEFFDAGEITYHPLFPNNKRVGERVIESEAGAAAVVRMCRRNYDRLAAGTIESDQQLEAIANTT